MTQRALHLLQKVLALTEEERAELAGTLIESLDGRADADAESAWFRKFARRIAEMDVGRAKNGLLGRSARANYLWHQEWRAPRRGGFEFQAAFEWYFVRSELAAARFVG